MKVLIAILLISSTTVAQTISTSLPKKIKESDKFLFYLHGSVVTVPGNNAINHKTKKSRKSDKEILLMAIVRKSLLRYPNP